MAGPAANVFNTVLDADIDSHMRRTRRRPMVQQSVPAGRAYVFGAVLGVLSAVILGFGTNWLSAS